MTALRPFQGSLTAAAYFTLGHSCWSWRLIHQQLSRCVYIFAASFAIAAFAYDTRFLHTIGGFGQHGGVCILAGVQCGGLKLCALCD